jgi:hypothetical protein
MVAAFTRTLEIAESIDDTDYRVPIDERGRRRAANRAEWFSQVDKPLEVHDIFGATQIGFQRG